jgi:hypothetical protein
MQQIIFDQLLLSDDLIVERTCLNIDKVLKEIFKNMYILYEL